MKSSCLSKFRPLMLGLLMGGAALGLVACSSPEAGSDIAAPPYASGGHHADDLPLAGSKGVKDRAYLDRELQISIARLGGMEETLGRLQSDLQGTTMAMQRVEIMRKQVESLNDRMKELQRKLGLVGHEMDALQADAQADVAAPVPDDAMTEAMIAEAKAKTAAYKESAADKTSQAEPMAAAPAGEATSPTPLIKGTITDEGHKKPIDAVAPVAEKPAPQMTPPPAKGEGVVGVRFGTHGDKVRMVLDVFGDTGKFSASLDNAEKLLTIDMPQVKWSAAKAESFKNHPLVASYSAQPSDKGAVVAVTLKAETKIVTTSTLRGSGGKPTRIVLDLQLPK